MNKNEIMKLMSEFGWDNTADLLLNLAVSNVSSLSTKEYTLLNDMYEAITGERF